MNEVDLKSALEMDAAVSRAVRLGERVEREVWAATEPAKADDSHTNGEQDEIDFAECERLGAAGFKRITLQIVAAAGGLMEDLQVAVDEARWDAAGPMLDLAERMVKLAERADALGDRHRIRR